MTAMLETCDSLIEIDAPNIASVPWHLDILRVLAF